MYRLVLIGSLALVGGCTRTPPTPAATSQPQAKEAVRTAESGPVRVTMRVDRDAIDIPETARLTVSIDAERGVFVSWPEIGKTLGPFAVKGTQTTQPTGDVLTERQEMTYTLDALVPGAAEIPALTFEYTDDRERADGTKGGVKGQVQCGPLEVTVRAALADIKGPESLPIPWPLKLLYWALGVLAAFVAIALLARKLRRRRAEAAAALPAALRLSPQAWALAELDRLIAENLPGTGRVQEFYYRINGLVRQYIELRFGLRAAEQTSEEFIRELQGAAVLRDVHKGLLRQFTDACDPVKYARLVPAPADINWVLQTARTFIVESAEPAPMNGHPVVAQEVAA